VAVGPLATFRWWKLRITRALLIHHGLVFKVILEHRYFDSRCRPVTEAKIDTAFIDPGKPWQNGSNDGVSGVNDFRRMNRQLNRSQLNPTAIHHSIGFDVLAHDISHDCQGLQRLPAALKKSRNCAVRGRPLLPLQTRTVLHDRRNDRHDPASRLGRLIGAGSLADRRVR
jgi:hypothetical protein